MVARGLVKRFGDFTAVNGLDLTVPRGRVYGFLGPNGCGKSTTIRMLCGLLTPSAGEVSVLDMQLPRDAERVKRRIGYMTQKFSLYDDLSVRENLGFLAAVHELPKAQAKERIDELCERYWLNELGERLVGKMSGGQRQRLALAGAVLHAPDLLLLDEPTSAVDPQSRREFWDSLFDLADAGTTLLVSTHYMDEAERCHRLAILDAGRLVADGSPRELMDSLPGHALKVDGDNLRQAQSQVAGMPGVLGVAQIGASLRVLVDGTVGGADALQRRLRAAGLDVQVQAVAANLEDVFVAATRAPVVHGGDA
ncbi:MAG: ABC transporter ATP-binding protein [Pseudomonadota bacterium]